MKTITTHTELVGLFNTATSELHLHLERECGTRSVSFYISTDDEKVGEGVMSTETETDEYGNVDYTDELAQAILEYFYNNFATVTEYDSLVAGTNPGIARRNSQP